MKLPGSGRRKPYTFRGIQRIKCTREGCDNPGFFQWQICADDRTYRVMCKECDIALNELTARFMWGEAADAVLADYRAKVLADG